jgi:hypothetical protein
MVSCGVGMSIELKQMNSMDEHAVMPLDVLGRTRATLTEPTSSFLVRKVWVILLNSVVLGIEHCNYCSSTRNS